jgi:RNA-directed DNA polymerase
VSEFNISSKIDLARALAVAPVEIEDVIQNRRRYYTNITVRKSNGGSRALRVPDGPLKLLQDKVKRHILDQLSPLDCVHGGVKGRSVLTNAKPHVGKRVLFTLDLKDFFPNVNQLTVRTIFQFFGFSGEALDELARIATWDDQLPQGAATSVGLANWAMYRVDVRLCRLAQQQGFAYTRYIDDLALSGGWRLLDFRRLVHRIVEQEEFRINPAKVRTMLAGSRQIVTGVVVNRRLNVPREQRDLIRGKVIQLRSCGGRRENDIQSLRGHLAWFSSVNPQRALRLQRVAFNTQELGRT